MTCRKIKGLRTIVTGTSSGIGREIAIVLAKQGARLIITARRGDRLKTLLSELISLGAEAVSVTGNITEHATRQSLLNAANDQFSGLDAIVNNAGVGAIGPFIHSTEERLRQVMEVNFFAPVELMRRAIPLLEQGQRPMIVNIGSVLGHRAVAYKSEYSASKFAMHGFSDALRCELAGQGIDVLLVSPSTTSSDFFDSVLDGKDDPANKIRYSMTPHAVARKTVQAMRRGKHEIILSAGGKTLVWLDRICPSLMNRVLSRC